MLNIYAVQEGATTMVDLLTAFCGKSDCLNSQSQACKSGFMLLSHPNSCINHAFILCFDCVLLFMLVFNMFRKSTTTPLRFHRYNSLQILSAIVNGCIGLLYLGLGVWTLEEKIRISKTALPMNWWLLILVQGFTWLFVSLILSLRSYSLPKAPMRLLSILAMLFSVIICAFSVFAAVLSKEVGLKIALDIISLPGSVLLLLCAYKVYNKYEGGDLYEPLNGENAKESVAEDGRFAEAGFFSEMSFWWLNSLMKKGREKTLGDEDMPGLRESDRAETCYIDFLDKLNEQKRNEPSSQQSIFWTIVSCYWKEILVSGFFALLKVLTISAGPLLLNAFILVAEGNVIFKYEGYVLAVTLFISKSLESLAQRQWYFRSRLTGLKVRSLLTAAIYKKQLRLSNAAKLQHSGGEIMNYVTVDAYRIGEFSFWSHQTWTTGLQLCFALVILFRAVGLATIAALFVIVLTVLANTPLAKLQHKFQTKLMVAQDERLKASTEALVNMKVLKLYAWETHFKNAIEKLREVECKWLSAVQMRKAYNSLLFWSSPVLVSAASFTACYFLNVPLHANNVFTFVATLRLVQDPVRSIPDVIGVVIQAKVAFSRIVKFLQAPELQSLKEGQKGNIENIDRAVLIKSANFSWEENSSKPTLRNINLQVRPGEKVAICGEVGSGKSTLLAAILGEVPNTSGNVSYYHCFFMQNV